MSNLFFRTLSQGVQAFAPIAAALVWFGRGADAPARRAIRYGLLLAAPATVAGAWWFARSDSRAIDQAILSTVALAIVAAMVIRGSATVPALAAATIVIVVRESMEIGSVFAVAAFQLRSLDATAAIAAATTTAGIAAWLFARVAGGLPTRLAVVAIRAFVAAFALQTVVYAFHEWAEARWLPWSEALHAATEPYGPEGIYGIQFSNLLVLAPFGAVAWSVLRARRRSDTRAAATVARRGLATGTLAAICFALMGLQLTDARHRAAPPAATPAELAPVLARPHLLFRDTAPGPNFGRLSVAPLEDVHHRLATGVTCERVGFAGGRGLCLHVDRGIFHRYSAVLLDAQLRSGTSIKLQGLPSRTRIAADGQVGAATVFVTGDDYAADFSTRTIVVDVASGDEIGELEQFATWRNGARFRAADFNFWGVTFAPDGHTFYASLRTAGTTYLVRGELALRRLTVLRANVECPSLSPDGRRLAYKKRVGPSPDSWRLHVLELATNAERIMNSETRYVDDQVEWLDAGHVLYAIPRRTTAISDVWEAAIDGSAPARIFLAEAESPIVVR